MIPSSWMVTCPPSPSIPRTCLVRAWVRSRCIRHKSGFKRLVFRRSVRTVNGMAKSKTEPIDLPDVRLLGCVVKCNVDLPQNQDLWVALCGSKRNPKPLPLLFSAGEVVRPWPGSQIAQLLFNRPKIPYLLLSVLLPGSQRYAGEPDPSDPCSGCS